VKKEDLIGSLREGLNAEERAIPIYTRHLQNTLFLSGLDKDFSEKIRNTLLRLAEESIQHERIFKALIKHIEGSAKDVY
jgi:rubrerythrin